MNDLKRHIFIALLSLAIASQLSTIEARPQSLSEEDRDKWLTEVRNYRHDFLTKELSLTGEQQREFFPVYDELEDELTRINTETRALERRVEADNNASDTEIESAARAVYEQKAKEGEIEMKYYDKIKDILSPKQLLKLKNAERKFTQQLLKQHRRFDKKNSSR